MQNLLDELLSSYESLDPSDRAEFKATVLAGTSQYNWIPNLGPQTEAYFSEADETFYGGAAGGGKALSLDTPLASPTGWTTMGAVQVGDELFDENGQICRVIGMSPVMIGRPCYRVKFSDGAEIVADADHRWVTQTAVERTRELRQQPEWQAERRRTRKSRATGRGLRPHVAAINAARADARRAALTREPLSSVRTTQEILESLLVGKRLNHSVAVAKALETGTADLPIDPYLFGAWLGDGTSAGGRMCIAEQEMATLVTAAAEQHGWSVKKGASTYDYGVTGGLTTALRTVGVINAKHIPRIYLRASRLQRVALLQGLMDTDGYADQRGQCEFTSVSRTLADGVLELVHSLGCKATICEGVATLNGREISPKYRIKFVTEFPAFRLSRKLERQKQAGLRGTTSRRYIEDCQPIASVPVKCIAVDSPNRLYLAGREMIPTHNTDLICGLALSAHTRTLVLRREGTDLRGIEQRMTDIMGGTDGYNQQRREWKLGDERVMELGSCQHEKDKFGYQGRPHDLKAFDEITQFLRSQYTYIIGWNRSTKEGQRCRVVCAGNPPSTPEGQWVKIEWGPWLDKTFPKGYRCVDVDNNPVEMPRAGPGELRWYTVDEATGDTVWVAEGWTGVDADGNIVYPKSRTFIPALLSDNPFLGSEYRARVAAMPEPLRSQLLYGDFNIAEKDQINQVLPTAWVRAAVARWTDEGANRPMIAMGVDVAQGGADKTVLAPRYMGDYIGTLISVPGRDTPDGPTAAAVVTTHVRHGATINIDMGGGFGQSTHDHLKDNKANVWPFIPSGSPTKGARDGLKYVNLRAQAYWELRQLLDPQSERKLCLPPDEELIADLCAPIWKLTPRGIQIEDKADIRKRIGRSPDKGDAVVIAFMKPLDDLEAELSLPAHLGRHRRQTPKPAPRDVLDTI